MPFYKSAARSGKKYAKKRFNKRYRKRRGGIRYGKLARDVYNLKRAINSETKFIDDNLTINPVRTSPYIVALDTPSKGLDVNDRVGRQVKYTRLTGKLMFIHENFGNITSNLTMTVHVMFLRNGNFWNDLSADPGPYILNPDFQGGFTPLSFFNQSNYKQWISVYKLKVTMKDLQPPSQSAYGLQTDPDGGNTETALGRQPQTQKRYIDINKKISVLTEWQNIYNETPGQDDTDVAKWKPFVFAYSDCTSQAVPSGTQQPSGQITDRIFCQGMLRMSYVDN